MLSFPEVRASWSIGTPAIDRRPSVDLLSDCSEGDSGLESMRAKVIR